MNPIDYTIKTTSPLEAMTQGLKFGEVLQAMDARRAAAEQQRALGTAFNDLVGKIRAGQARGADFHHLALLAPKDQSEALLKVWESMNTERQQNSLAFGAQVMSALGSQNPQIGIDLINDMAAAERASGNEAQARAYDTWAQIAKIDPARAQATIGGMIYGLPGGDKAIKALIDSRTEARTSEAHQAAMDIMRGVQTMDDLEERLPAIAALGIQGLEIVKGLDTAMRLREESKFKRDAAKEKQLLEQVETGKAVNLLNTLIAGSTRETPAFIASADGLAENPSFWEKYKFIPTAGGPDMAVPGAVPAKVPEFDADRAAALGLDKGTLELVKAQIALDPKGGARLLSQIITANIKKKLAPSEKMSPYAKMLEEAGIPVGSPEFQRMMLEHTQAQTKGAAKGQSLEVTVGEAQKVRGKEFGKFAQAALEKSQNASDAASDISMIVDGMRGMGGGPVAQFKAWVGQFAPPGTEWANIASMSELANTIQAKLAPTMREAGSGSTSDMEMKSFMRAIPSIQTTERGRELMAKYARRIAERSQIRAEIINDLERADKLPSPAAITAQMRSRIGDSFFDVADREYFGMKSTGVKPETATVGGKIYTRPASFTDAQWQAYKENVGAK